LYKVYFLWGGGSSVNVVSKLQADRSRNPDFFSAGQDIFFFSQTSGPPLGLTNFLRNGFSGFFPRN